MFALIIIIIIIIIIVIVIFCYYYYYYYYYYISVWPPCDVTTRCALSQLLPRPVTFDFPGFTVHILAVSVTTGRRSPLSGLHITPAFLPFTSSFPCGQDEEDVAEGDAKKAEIVGNILLLLLCCCAQDHFQCCSFCVSRVPRSLIFLLVSAFSLSYAKSQHTSVP